jgi:hypothetical protein
MVGFSFEHFVKGSVLLLTSKAPQAKKQARKAAGLKRSITQIAIFDTIYPKEISIDQRKAKQKNEQM